MRPALSDSLWWRGPFTFMPMIDIQTLAVVGAGTMGLGIAQLGIQHGLPTILFDLNPTALEKAQAAIAAGLAKLVDKNKLTAADRGKKVSVRATARRYGYATGSATSTAYNVS